MKKTLPLIIIGAVLLSIELVLFFINILMLSSVIGASPAEIEEISKQPGLIGYLTGHLVAYGFLIVFPFFVFGILGTFLLVFGIVRGKTLDKRTAKGQN